MFALPTYKGLIVGTPEQGEDFTINLVENVKEISLFLPSSPTRQKWSPSERTLSPAGLAAPSTPCPTLCWTCWPWPQCCNIGEENLFPKDPRVFWRKYPCLLELWSCHLRRELHANPLASFQNAKSPEDTEVSPYPTKKIQLQFFTCGTTPESSEVIHQRPHVKVRYQKPRQESTSLTSSLRPCGPVPCPGSCSTIPEEKVVPRLQADGDVIQPTSLPFLLRSLCSSQLARRCSHTPRLFALHLTPNSSGKCWKCCYWSCFQSQL